MKVNPLFKWFGSKWQSAKHYPKPEHPVIIEPFAGGAGYSLNYSDRQVVLWEDDANLHALWSWLICEADQASIKDIPINVPAGTDIRTLGLSHGQCLLLKHWQRTNNVGDCWTISSWGHLPGQWTANTRARVSEEVSAVKHWLLVKPADMLNFSATWFIDPPYFYNYRYDKKLPDFDFSALAAFVKKINDQSLVVVCEACDKATGKIPDYLPFVSSHKSVTSRRKITQSHHSNEVIYVRKPVLLTAS